MKKLVAATLVASLMSFGCSQNSGNWAPSQIEMFLPEVHDISSVVTQQALIKQSAEVKKAVNVVSKNVYDALNGQLSINQSQIDSLVATAISKANLSPQIQSIVKPIVSSVLLIGLHSVEGKINAAGQEIAKNNALVVDFVKAAASGVVDGSEVANTPTDKVLLSPKK